MVICIYISQWHDVFHTTIDLYIVQGHQNNKTRDTHYKRHNIYNFEQHWKLKIELLLTSMKTRGEIRCPIANTRVKHSKKAKQNMHMTVNFLGLFFRTGKIFFGLTRSSCLSVRMTDNFSASFGKSGPIVNKCALAACVCRDTVVLGHFQNCFWCCQTPSCQLQKFVQPFDYPPTCTL